MLEDIFTTFPDWHVEIVEMVTEGDSVVMRCKVSGTHRGTGKIPVNGGMLVNVAPTGKHFETDHIQWLKFRDGKIVDHYATRDDIGMMRQLGLLPPVRLCQQIQNSVASVIRVYDAAGNVTETHAGEIPRRESNRVRRNCAGT